jgi:hypothetical protein
VHESSKTEDYASFIHNVACRNVYEYLNNCSREAEADFGASAV